MSRSDPILNEGHTDSTGGVANIVPSSTRADAVRDLFIGYGVAPDHVVAFGYGAASPVASEAVLLDPNRTAADDRR